MIRRPAAVAAVVTALALLAACSAPARPTGAPVALSADQARGALATLDLHAADAGPGYARTLAGTARDLRLEQLRWRYAGPGPTPDSVSADVTWRLPEDRRAAASRVTVALTRVAGEVRPEVAGVRGAGGRWPSWLAGPVVVRRAPGVLVVAAGSAASAHGYAVLAERALAEVRRVVPVRRPLVVEVPSSAAMLTDVLAGRPGEYAGVAATTTTADGRLDAAAPVRVLVDPGVLDPLGRRARLVVLAHEATHAETGAATARLPVWLAEGFADHVALRSVRLPVRRLAAHALAAVRAHGRPSRLRRAAAFHGPDAEAAYEEAWLAVQVLVEHGGKGRLVRLYDAVRAGAPLPTALERIFVTSQATLTRWWGDRLARLAR